MQNKEEEKPEWACLEYGDKGHDWMECQKCLEEYERSHTTFCFACGKVPIDRKVSCMCPECKKKCSHCGGGDAYPVYGLAPHSHGDAWKTGKFIVSTKIDKKETWPANFREDPEAPGCGIYSCPVCGKGSEMNDDKT